jgi:penicillin-binding protein activator
MLRSHPRTLIAGLAVAVLTLSGCANRRVERIDPNSVTDLSGRWNDADSRLVANALITQSLEATWARDYAAANGGTAPTVIVGQIRNRTMEHIPIGTFVRDLERAYVQTGVVRLVASAEEREEIREERADQQTNASAETRARMAREMGARFMLQGDVQAIEDTEGRERIVFYQVDVTLIDLETNVRTWMGQHKIKKYIQRRRLTP